MQLPPRSAPSGWQQYLPEELRIRRNQVSVGIGILVGITLAILLGTSANCVLHYGFSQFDSTVVLFVLGAPAAALGSFVLGKLDTGLPKKYSRITFLVARSMLVGIPLLLVRFTLAAPPHGMCDPSFCSAYDPALHIQTPEHLIAREGEAVLSKNISLISDIYAPDATVFNQAEQRTWSALAYYPMKFASEDHCTLEHFNLTSTPITDQSVKVCGQSRGAFKLTSSPPPCGITYENTACADQWTVVRDPDYCWRIQSLSFNNPPPQITPNTGNGTP